MNVRPPTPPSVLATRPGAVRHMPHPHQQGVLCPVRHGAASLHRAQGGAQARAASVSAGRVAVKPSRYNDTRANYKDTPEYNRFLEERENLINNLAAGRNDAQWEKLEAELKNYERQNAARISENIAAQVGSKVRRLSVAAK
ncbi:CDK-activating kinase assembly factor MAT1 protein [Babesia caballi]|uniref:CDK-activating kinase assembly factor MAT1 protein n=1 Tax=Babesia caballi TaxID=5871 RepID=A0AAV4LUG5_BABCB|nr:CDK-activating kinase assembly factor MAT1 protein [Babesia caballi]